MSWLHFSAIPPLIWATVNLVDKVVVTRFVSRATVYLIFTGLSAVLPVAAMPAFVHLEALGPWILALSLATGILYIVYTWFFFRSLQISDAPVVATLLLLVPLLSVGWGAWLFGEVFHFTAYLGVACVLLGVLGVSLEFQKRRAPNSPGIRLSAALLLMSISAVITSLDYALEKHILSYTNQVTLFYWNRVGMLVACAAILAVPRGPRRDFLATVRAIPRVILPVSLLNELLDMTAAFALITAYSVGPLSLVTTVASTQPVFVLFLMAILNRLKPGFVPGVRGMRVFVIRLASIVVTIAGVYLISASR